MLDILLAIALGILAGTVTGLVPGLHINLVAVTVVALPFAPREVAVFLVAMSVVHTFLDFIPAVFLGAPEPSTALSVMPAHRLLHKGYGYEAALLSLYGSFFGLLFALLLVPIGLLLYRLSLPPLFLSLLLLLIILILAAKEKRRKEAAVVIILSAILGFLVLDLPLSEPLLPLFSGLFGVSTLIGSLLSVSAIPAQLIKAPTKSFISGAGIGALLGLVINVFPAIGPSQAAVAGTLFARSSVKKYLVTLGAINTSAMVLSLVSLFVAGKGRNGSIEVVGELVAVDFSLLVVLLAVAAITLPFAFLLTVFFSRLFARVVTKLPYKAIAGGTLLLIAAIVAAVDGVLGLVALLAAATVGLTAHFGGVSKSHCMASLIVPTMHIFITGR